MQHYCKIIRACGEPELHIIAEDPKIRGGVYNQRRSLDAFFNRRSTELAKALRDGTAWTMKNRYSRIYEEDVKEQIRLFDFKQFEHATVFDFYKHVGYEGNDKSYITKEEYQC